MIGSIRFPPSTSTRSPEWTRRCSSSWTSQSPKRSLRGLLVGLQWCSAWSEEALTDDPSDEGLPALLQGVACSPLHPRAPGMNGRDYGRPSTAKILSVAYLSPILRAST